MTRADLPQAALACPWPVFPCAPNKAPAISKKEGGQGFHDASRDPATIARLFGHRNAALIGVPTGPASGFDVLDLDYRHGAADWEWRNRHRLPETRAHRTRSGGRHLLFIANPDVRNSASQVEPGVDVRATGGFAIVPPSDGYTVDSDADLAPWPDWLLPLVLPVVRERPVPHYEPRRPLPDGWIERRVDSILANVRSAPEGQKHVELRNAALALGGWLHLGGYSRTEAVAWLLAALPSTVQDWKAAQRTAEWGLDTGAAEPLEPPA